METWLTLTLLLVAASVVSAVPTQKRAVTAECPSARIRHSIQHDLPWMTKCPAKVVFLLDGSDSIADADFLEAKNFVVSSIESLIQDHPQTDFGVLLFSSNVTNWVDLRTRNAYETSQAINTVRSWSQPKGGTDLYPALRRARVWLEFHDRMRDGLVVQVTDGCAVNLDKIRTEAQELCKSDYNILSVTVGMSYMDILSQISMSLHEVRTPLVWNDIIACPREMPTNVPATSDCEDVMFVLDGSDSVKRHEAILTAWLHNTVGLFHDVNNAMGATMFGYDVEWAVAPLVNKTELMLELALQFNLPLTGTGTTDGITRAAELISRVPSSRAKTIVLVTDGPPLSPTNAAAAVARAKALGIRVVVVGVGSVLTRNDLIQLSGGDASTVRQYDSYIGLYGLNLEDLVCSAGQPRTCTNTCFNGGVASLVNDQCGCVCVNGFTGPDCSARDCSLNCGVGTLSTTDCACICPTNFVFTGTTCAQVVPVCNLQCGNGVLVQQPCSCSCFQGFQYDTTQQTCVQTCDITCTNGYRNPNGACECICFQGFEYNAATGSCVQSVPTCTRVCQNGGQLLQQQCQCLCPVETTGEFCEQCATNFVQRNGLCTCESPFTRQGQSCVLANPCENVNCGANGFTVPSGTTCSCQCNAGYTLNSIGQCQQDCAALLNCGFNGRAETQYNGLCGCTCLNGYTGTDCSTAPNPCENVNCGANATPFPSGTTCSCQCNSGYTLNSIGQCQQDCAALLNCGFNGRAETQYNGLCGCTCLNGYTGTDCSTPPNPCENVNCGANGFTVPSGTTCSCQCNSGYTLNSIGQCQQANPCENVNCGANGFTVPSGTTCSCQCNAGYTLNSIGQCQQANPCENVNCGANATPFPSGTTCSCQCNSGYTLNAFGQCQQDCAALVNCGLNGRAETQSNGFCGCTCLNGYTGTDCSTAPRTCLLDCGVGQLDLTNCACICPNNYYFDNVQQTCLLQPTSCTIECGANGFRDSANCRCNCVNGYTGDFCQVPPCLLNCGVGQLDQTNCACLCPNGFYFDAQQQTCLQQPTSCTIECGANGVRDSANCRCNCVNSYTGDFCQVPPAQTCSLQCQNGGILNADQCLCQCVGNFTGPTCALTLTTTECLGARNPCQNGQPAFEDCNGRCVCRCNTRLFRGPYCEIFATESAGLCDECTYENGVGYVPFRTRCDMFVKCQRLGDGTITAHVLNCGDDTLWNQNTLTCDHPSLVTCQYDACQNLSAGARYSHVSACQSYWQCNNQGRTIGQGCCDPGYGLRNGNCVPDPTCPRTCRSGGDNDLISCNAGRSAGVVDCNLEGNPANPSQYRHKSNGGTVYPWQPCAANMVFREEFPCGCYPPTGRGGVCVVDKEVTFDQAIKGVGIVSGVPGAFDNSGVGEFLGANSHTVERFADSGFNFPLHILTRVQPRGLQPGRQYAVITNGDCNITSSLSISMDTSQVYFMLKLEGEQQPVQASLPYTNSQNGWVEIEMHYDRTETANGNGFQYRFWASVNGQRTQVERTYANPIELRKCGVQIGKGTGMENFLGYIDQTEFWTCTPPGMV